MVWVSLVLVLTVITGLASPSSVEAQGVCQSSSDLQLLEPNKPSVSVISGSGSGAVKCFVFNDTTSSDDIAIEVSVSSGGAVAYVRQASFISNDWTLTAFNGSTDWLVVRSGDPKRVGGPLLIILFGTTAGINKIQLRAFQNPASNATTDNLVLAAFRDLKLRCCESCQADWWKANTPDPCLFPGSFCDGNPRQLKQLTLSSIFKCDLPLDIISRFTELEVLELRNNDLSSTTQVNWTALTSLPKLKYLDLFGNNLGGDVSCALLSSNLTYINLMQNQFTGAWPSCLLKKDDLTVLRLGFNGLTGELRDSDFSPTSQLQWLNLHGLGLVGQIPIQLGLLPSLTLLDLGGNALTGSFPAQFNGSSIMHLLLENNQLSGALPDFAQAMPNLQTMSLSGNILGTTLPESITRLPSLQTFECSNCGLWGEVPEDWGSMASLQVLNLGGNRLNGTLKSSAFFAMPNLAVLDISSNAFTGPLPDVPVGSQLYYFNGSRNEFSGPIPDSFQNMPLTSLFLLVVQNTIFFSTLDLSFNHLAGPIPPTMNSSSKAVFLLQGNDGLTCTGPPFGGVACSSSYTSEASYKNRRHHNAAIVAAISIGIAVGLAFLAALAFVIIRWTRKHREAAAATAFKRFQPETTTTTTSDSQPPDPAPL